MNSPAPSIPMTRQVNEKAKLSVIGMKKKPIIRARNTIHLKNQNPFWTYDLGSLLEQTQVITSIKTKKKIAIARHIL